MGHRWAGALLLASMLILSIAGYNSYNVVFPSAHAYSDEENQLISKYSQPEDIMIKSSIKINVVMLGETWPDINEVQKQLLESYEPMIIEQNRTAGVEFEYNYNFVQAPASVSDELFSYIDSIAVDNSSDLPISLVDWLADKYKNFKVVEDTEGADDDYTGMESEDEGGYFYLYCTRSENECKKQVPYGVDTKPICLYDSCGLYKINYKWIDASLVEEWLHKKGLATEGYTIFFLRSPSTHMNYLHSYGITTEDADKDKKFRQEGMMGFGGKHRFYFIDLNAGPSYYPDVPIPEVATVFHKNIFDIANEQEYQKLFVNYINDAIALLFTPSYLYEPTYKSKYLLDIFIIDQTTGKSFATIAPQYLTSKKLESSMKNLVPYSEWKSKIEGKSFDWLPRELGRAIIRSMSFDTNQGIDTISINSATLPVELDKWKKSNLTPQQAEELEKEKETTVYLPVIILVLDAYAYVDDGALGRALPDVNDPRVACCVIIATDKNTLVDFDVGLTSITVHEVAHLLGLMHPHDGYREDLKDGWLQNWFFDWSSTPMTYAGPIGYGCGEWEADDSGHFSPKECGMSISTFNQFNYDSVDRGLILYLLRQSLENIRNTLDILETKGYTDSLPSNIGIALISVDHDIETVKEQFLKMNYFDRSGSLNKDNTNALDLTLQVLKNSQMLLQQTNESEAFVPKQEEPKEQQPVVEPPASEFPSSQDTGEQHDISVAMKLKKKSTLLAVKNTGDAEIYSVKIKASDGNVRYVKAKGWDREKVDASTVIVRTSDKPLIEGKSLVVILVIDNKGSGIEWTALDAKAGILSSGALIPK